MRDTGFLDCQRRTQLKDYPSAIEQKDHRRQVFARISPKTKAITTLFDVSQNERKVNLKEKLF